MTDIERIIKVSIENSPLPLLAMNDEHRDYMDSFLPFSTGFEIECNKKSNFDISKFTDIPNIMEVNCDSSEQRFRIPNGLNGIICLYNICEQLKLNSELNLGSGIHYHIDCTDWYNKMMEEPINHGWIYDELDTWNYEGTFNKRSIGTGHCWIRLNSQFNTAEFRIGEMSFDYKVLIKRIIHANSIVKRWKKETLLEDKPIIYSTFNKLQVLEYIKNVNLHNPISEKLLKLDYLLEVEKEPILIIPTSDEIMRETIKQRQIKL